MGPDIRDRDENLVTDNEPNQYSEKDIVSIGQVLNSPSTPLADRFRALFTLKNLGGPSAIEAIGRGFDDPANGALIKHELAYCLGQMGDVAAIPILTAVLKTVGEDPMVRFKYATA